MKNKVPKWPLMTDMKAKQERKRRVWGHQTPPKSRDPEIQKGAGSLDSVCHSAWSFQELY
jgi:hypothetical protein